MTELLILGVVIFLLVIVDTGYEDALTRFLLLNSVIALISVSIALTSSFTIALFPTILLFGINFVSYKIAVKKNK